MTDAIRNWAGNLTYGAKTVAKPGTITELQDVVRGAGKLRALGSRHSFSSIADSDDTLVSLRGLNRVIEIDTAGRKVTAEGGITYGELCPVLDAAGFALHNLASLPHISVAGAVSTGTHGSGSGNRNLASAVSALEFVTADGELRTIARGDPDFDGAVVGLGGLGVVSKVTLDLQPRFEVRQQVFLEMPFDAFVENFAAVSGSAYSVSAFTHWQGDTIAHVWLKNLAGAPQRVGDMFGARLAERNYHPIETMDAGPATEQMGDPGPWHLRLPHFRMEFTPSAGEELQSEYFVPLADAPAALKALRAVQDRFATPLMISEIRTIKGDELWMSMNYRRDSLAFHFTWYRDWPAVQQVLPVVEHALAPFGARPHWGKVFTLPKAELQSRYERLGDFRALLGRLDPGGKFRNAFLDEFVF